MFLFCSHGVNPSFQATLDPDPGEFRVLHRQGRQRRDGGWLFCRDDTQRYSVGASKLTSEEARRIGKAISRIPEFMMPHQGFYPRGGGPRWRADRWTPSCFGIASRGAGYAARSFIIQSVRPICRP